MNRKFPYIYDKILIHFPTKKIKRSNLLIKMQNETGNEFSEKLVIF